MTPFKLAKRIADLKGMGGFVKCRGPGGKSGATGDVSPEEQSTAGGIKIIGNDGIVLHHLDIIHPFIFEKHESNLSTSMGGGSIDTSPLGHDGLMTGGRPLGKKDGGDENNAYDEKMHMGTVAGIRVQANRVCGVLAKEAAA